MSARLYLQPKIMKLDEDSMVVEQIGFEREKAYYVKPSLA
jgi:hypothetical protein